MLFTDNLEGGRVKPDLSGHWGIDKTKILMANGSLMKVERIAECSSILQYFWHVLSDNPFGLLFEWPLKTGFTVLLSNNTGDIWN